jgi:hypothetical protein
MAFPDVQSDGPSPARATAGFGRLMLAYAVACLVATLLLPLALFLRDAAVLGTGAVGADVSFGDVAAIVVIGFPLVFVFAAPFATTLIVVTQTLHIGGLPVYLAGGAAIGPVVGLIAHLMPSLGPAAPPAHWGSYLVYATIGLPAAAVFWALAIRPRRRRR